MGSINKVVSLIVKMSHANILIRINMWLLTFTAKIGLYLHYVCVKSVSTIKTTAGHRPHNPKLVLQKEKKDIFLSLIMRSTIANANKFPLKQQITHTQTNSRVCVSMHTCTVISTQQHHSHMNKQQSWPLLSMEMHDWEFAQTNMQTTCLWWTWSRFSRQIVWGLAATTGSLNMTQSESSRECLLLQVRIKSLRCSKCCRNNWKGWSC